MKIGIIGFGSIGQRHTENLIDLGGHELKACDPMFAMKAYAYKSQYVDIVPLKELWGWKPKAVLICTPPDSHAALALAAIRQKIHTFIEKPVATTIDDADLIRWEAKNSGVQLAIGYQLAWQLGDVPSGKDVTWECSQDMSRWPSRYEKDVLLEF
jgi:predicted dehydrogenase